MPPDRAPDQPLTRKVVEPAGAAIPLPRGEHERQIARAAGLAKPFRQSNEQLLRNGKPDESADRQRVTIDDQINGRLGRHDLPASPSRHGGADSRHSSISSWGAGPSGADSRSRESTDGKRVPEPRDSSGPAPQNPTVGVS